MFPQSAFSRKCAITLGALLGLFPTVCFKTCHQFVLQLPPSPHMIIHFTFVRKCIITTVAFLASSPLCIPKCVLEMAFFKNVEAHSMHLIFYVRKKKTKLPRLGGRGVKVIREMPESKRFFRLMSSRHSKSVKNSTNTA